MSPKSALPYITPAIWKVGFSKLRKDAEASRVLVRRGQFRSPHLFLGALFNLGCTSKILHFFHYFFSQLKFFGGTTWRKDQEMDLLIAQGYKQEALP
jgi:hypothetical protein